MGNSDRYDSVMFNLPLGTKQRIKSLAMPHESMTSVILRAIDLLEQQPNSDAQSIPVNYDIDNAIATMRCELESQINSLNERLTVIEQSGNSRVTAIKTRPQGNLPPLVAPPFDSDADCWRWAYDRHCDGYPLSVINAALPPPLRKSNPSRLKNEWATLVGIENE